MGLNNIIFNLDIKYQQLFNDINQLLINLRFKLLYIKLSIIKFFHFNFLKEISGFIFFWSF